MTRPGCSGVLFCHEFSASHAALLHSYLAQHGSGWRRSGGCTGRGLDKSAAQSCVKGLRYTEDETLNSIFLQTVVAMSEKSYMRRLLSLTIRQGIPRPVEFDEFENLLKALSTNLHSVTYMWKDDAVRSPNVKILRVLWQQN